MTNKDGMTVIMSDIPVYKEVYGDFPVTFFETGNAEDLYQHLLALPSAPVNLDEQLSSTYHYQNTAKIIIDELFFYYPYNKTHRDSLQ
jgi:hypothetical protein